MAAVAASELLPVAFGIAIAVGRVEVVLMACAMVLALVVGLWAPRPELLGVVPLFLVVAAPWQRTEAFAGRVYVYPVFWAALLTVVLLVLIRGYRFVRPDAVVLFGLAYAAWMVFRRLAGYGDTAGLLRWLGLWSTGVLAYYLVRPYEVADWLRRWAWAACGLLGAYGGIEWLLKQNILFGQLVPVAVEPAFLEPSQYRSQATLGHPLAFADVIGFLVVVAVLNELEQSRLSLRRLCGIALGMVGLIVSGGRGAILLAGACVIVSVIVTRAGGRASVRRAAATLAILSLLVVIGLPIVGERFVGATRTESFRQRLRSIDIAVAVVRESPVFGTRASNAYEELASRGLAVNIPESEYAARAISGGLPGLAMVLAIPAAAWLASRRRGLGWATLPVAVYSLGIIGTHNYFDWWGGAAAYFSMSAVISAWTRSDAWPADAGVHE